MRMFTDKTSYDDTIVYARELVETYDAPVIFHCYWNTQKRGGLSEKHLYSVLSCWYFNVRNNKHKIILWLENTELNEYAGQIKQYAEIRQFEVDKETQGTFLEGYVFGHKEKRPGVKFYSDYVRQVLLLNYGGVWFDLDCFFLRCFDPLFAEFEDELCYYYLNKYFANNAIVLSLQPQSNKIKSFIRFLAKRDKSWGFGDGGLPYTLAEDALVLPCAWFDPCVVYGRVYRRDRESFFSNTTKVVGFDNFYPGAFCYHWHNSWDYEVGRTSPMAQLVNYIKKELDAGG